MFISFEGLDGCGKTTQAAMLADALEAEGQRIVLDDSRRGSVVVRDNTLGEWKSSSVFQARCLRPPQRTDGENENAG